MAYFKVTKKQEGGSENQIIPLSLVSGTVTKQNNRSTITISENTLVSPISNSSDCMGIISVPIAIPEGYNAVLIKYTLGAPSFETGYSATIFFSTYLVTNASARTADLIGKTLVQANINWGGSSNGPNYDGLRIPSNATHFNFQLGTSNFEKAEIFFMKTEETT